MTKIATFSRHHGCEAPPWKQAVRDVEEAVCVAVESMTGEELDPMDVRAVLLKLWAEGEATLSLPDEGDVALWYKNGPSEQVDGHPNFGVGYGTQVSKTNKHENVWIVLKDFVPDPAEKAALLSLSKEELVGKLLLAKALEP